MARKMKTADKHAHDVIPNHYSAVRKAKGLGKKRGAKSR